MFSALYFKHGVDPTPEKNLKKKKASENKRKKKRNSSK